MFKSVFCTTLVLEKCLQQVGFVNLRHFFQHRSRAKHWFKNLKILDNQKKEKFMKKNRRFIVSEFVKTCDELDLLLEAIMLGMATAGNVTVVQVIHFQSAYFLSSLPSAEQAELVGFKIFLIILIIRVICSTFSWLFRFDSVFVISFDFFYVF